MKFACPNCKTRYSIADEKLPTGASVKFRCKTCGTSIRLKRKQETPTPAPEELPDMDSPAASTRVAPLGQLQELRRQAAAERAPVEHGVAPRPEPQPESEPEEMTSAATAVVSLNQLNELRSQSAREAPQPDEPAEWYVLIAGEQKGPVSVSAVRGMLASKEVNERTFVWMNGMADWKRLGDVAALRELTSPPRVPAPSGGFSEATATMDSATLQQHIAAARAEGAQPEEIHSESTAMMDSTTLQQHIAAARAERSPAPLGDDITPADSRVAEPAPARQARIDAKMTTLPGVDLGAFGPEPAAPAANPSFAPFEDDGAHQAITGSYPSLDSVEAGEATAPEVFHKARTEVHPLGDVAAAMELAGEPVGAGMARDDFSLPGAPIEFDESDMSGHSGSPFDRPGDAALEDAGEPPESDEAERAEGYQDAPPGEQTRVFMATAGIFKRRRNHLIAAAVAFVVIGSLSGIIALDVMGVYTIPGMGLAYDLTGFEDPNTDRAIERTRAKLQSADDPAERKRLQAKLLGLGQEAPDGPKKARGTKKADAKDVVTEGIKDETDLSEQKKSLAGSLFEDERKSGAAPKLKAPQEITTADLPDGLTQEAIQKVIAEKQSSMKLCLTEAFRKGEKLSGRMEVQITIDATGKVTEAAINTDKYKSSSMGECTVKRVQTWKFPRFNGDPVTVVFPYVLTLGL